MRLHKGHAAPLALLKGYLSWKSLTCCISINIPLCNRYNVPLDVVLFSTRVGAFSKKFDVKRGRFLSVLPLPSDYTGL